MYTNRNKTIKATGILALILLVLACNTQKEENRHDKETETKEHEEKEQRRVSLTEEQIKTVAIQYGSIKQKQLTATIKANGNLRVPNNHQAHATSLFGGVIKSLDVQTGDYVKKGQVIATITNTQFIQIQEEYLTIESKITFAEQEAQRQIELNKGGAGTLRNLQNSETEVKSLKTRKASLEQQIQLMGINPNGINNNNLKSSATITSPINGTISTLFAKIGSSIDVASPIAEIIDNSQLHLDLQVFEKDLPKLKVNQTIHFTLTNNPTTEYDAKVYSIGSSFENDSKTIAIHCAVTGNKTGLIDGMNITGLISLDHVTSPAVPNDAIVHDNGNYYIFVMTNTEIEEPHKDETKEHLDKKELNKTYFEKIEILKGVSELGYTAITLISDVPPNATIVTKGAFFINAKLSNTGEHAH